MVEGDERLSRFDLVPSVAFVWRLPNAVVREPDQDDGRVAEVRILDDRAWEIELKPDGIRTGSSAYEDILTV